MHEGEGHRAERSAQAPAVGGKERFHFHETSRPGEAAFCQVSHDDDGKDNLVGRESEDEGQEDDAVKSHESRERVQKIRTEGKKAFSSRRYICQEPEQHACRSGNSGSPTEDKQRALQDGAEDDLSKLRAAVRRQFQHKGGGSAFQNGG